MVFSSLKYHIIENESHIGYIATFCVRLAILTR